MPTFIDLFAGIGGFHLGMAKAGCRCVFACEKDDNARATYLHNFRTEVPNLEEIFAKDIIQLDSAAIPDFDILCGGFPCQPFSQAGKGKGFDDARGTLFFEIAKILKERQPRAFFLENVQRLKSHDHGKTFQTIQRILTQDLGYSFHWKVLKASDFGLPQRRPRLFMVGFKDTATPFSFPIRMPLEFTMSDVLGGPCTREIGFTLRVGGRGSGLHDRRNWDCYSVAGKTVRLSVAHGKKLQGFPDDFHFPVSETQAMKQLGNSVAVPAIWKIGEQVVRALAE